MKDIADGLRWVIEIALPLLNRLSDAEAAIKPAPGKWSKKEIIGHLIDSAGNNQQKFIRSMAQDGLEFPGYAQDFWVASQKYNEREWAGLISLWHFMNLHIADVIEGADPALLGNTVRIDGSGPFTLEFIMKDYPEHQKHHLNQVFPDLNLKHTFENLYNA